MEDDDGKILYLAPLNARQEPTRRDIPKWTPSGSRTVPVIVYLVWRDRVQILPAEALTWTRRECLVEWHPKFGSTTTRRTWLPRADVVRELEMPVERYRRESRQE